MRTFSLYFHSDQSTTPTLAFEIASDEATVRMMAERGLKESSHRLLVEVREADRLLFTLERDGSLYRNPRLEPLSPTAHPAAAQPSATGAA